MNGTAAATVAIYNDNNDLDVLARDAKVLTEKLRAIEGVGSVNALGSPEKQIQITALEGLDITALAIVQALSKENLDLPLGTVYKTVRSFRYATPPTLKSVLEIMRLPVVMDLGASAISSLAAMQTAVKTYANCTLGEFNDYVKKRWMQKVIDETDGKTYEELAERQNALSGVKSLMTLVRENSSQSLRLMWHTIDVNLVKTTSLRVWTTTICVNFPSKLICRTICLNGFKAGQRTERSKKIGISSLRLGIFSRCGY